MFGGGGGQEMRPQYVLNEWSLATDLMKEFKGTVCQAWHSHELHTPAHSHILTDLMISALIWCVKAHSNTLCCT